MLANAHQEVLWLDVSVNDSLGMDVLKATNELISEH
jgi:hypothetical protein